MSTATTSRPAVWADPAVLASTLQAYLSALGLRLVLLAVFAFADLVFIKGTLDLVLNEQEFVSWSIAIMLTVGSIAIMINAGFLSLKAQAEGHGRAGAIALVAAWALLGTALVVMRFNGAEWTSTALAAEGQFGAVDETAKHQGLALLLGLIYISSGALAFFDGRHINPIAIAYLRLKARNERLTDEIIAQRGVVAKNIEDLERAKGILQQVPDGRKAAEQRLRFRAQELTALARVRTAVLLGDPASTGVTEIEPHPFASSHDNQEGGR